MLLRNLAPAALLALGALPAVAQRPGVTAVPDSVVAKVDSAFAAFARPGSPGCAVGVARGGRPVLTRAYGLANLEYDVPLTPESVFESGSVAKQFTAAALALLAADGKLSLDDDVRKYVPEVPRFGGETITVRHLLNHTSGLRDQWGLLGLAGRGPGTQVHSPATTVDLVSRQRALNFPPGAEYLYSNSGYALAGVIVERVSGQSLDAFTQARLFRPLGMTKTQWRDDHTEVVPGRATAYAPARGGGGGFRTDMSFTNMVGNGGLLTTVGDLLTWNAALDSARVLGRAAVDSLHVRGRLRGGRTIDYALGLTVTSYGGTKEVSHGGSTAGYRTFLARYPERGVSVALLCNTGTANPGLLAHRVADAVLARPAAAGGAGPAGEPSETPVALTAEQLGRWAGAYRSARTGDVLPLAARGGALFNAVAPNAPLVALAPDRVRLRDGTVLALTGQAGRGARGPLVARTPDGDTVTYAPMAAADPARLGEYAGRYWSDEIETELVVTAKDGKLVVFSRPADSATADPLYQDGFGGPDVGFVHFTRDRAGRFTGFEVTAGRVRHVRFERRAGRPADATR